MAAAPRRFRVILANPFARPTIVSISFNRKTLYTRTKLMRLVPYRSAHQTSHYIFDPRTDAK